jgi:hypothetical protein
MTASRYTQAHTFLATLRATCCAGALTAACHEPATSNDSVSDAGQRLRQIWNTAPLCDEGFAISNLAVPGATLAAHPPDERDAKQVVGLVDVAEVIGNMDLWYLLPGVTPQGYWLSNVDPPWHYLSDALDARIAKTGEEGSDGLALEWVFRRAGKLNTNDSFEDVTFQLIPGRIADSALQAGVLETDAREPRPLELAPLSDATAAPNTQLWTLKRVPLCQ